MRTRLIPVRVPVAVPPRMRALMVLPLAQIVPPVLITVAIVTVEVTMRIVAPGTAMIASVLTSMIAVVAPVSIVVEPIHRIDQRIGDGRTNQQINGRVAVVARVSTQRNRQAQRKPCSGKPFRAVSGSNVSGNELSVCIHRLVLF